MNNDEELLTRARQLEPEALKSLHQRFYGPVARYIQLKVGNRETVEDLSGEVFVRVLEGLRRGQGWRKSPQAWIMGIARHVVADHYRNRERAPEVKLTDDVMAAEESAPPYRAILSERKRLLWQAIHQLTDDQRDVVLMRFMAGVDIRGVAEAVNKTPGAVKALQYRALRVLAKKMNGILKEGK